MVNLIEREDELIEMQHMGEEKVVEFAETLAKECEKGGALLAADCLRLWAYDAAVDQHPFLGNLLYLPRACKLAKNIAESEPLEKLYARALELVARPLLRTPRYLGGNPRLADRCIKVALDRAHFDFDSMHYITRALLYIRRGEAMLQLGWEIEDEEVKDYFMAAYKLLPQEVRAVSDEEEQRMHQTFGFIPRKIENDDTLEITRNELPILYSIGLYLRERKSLKDRQLGIKLLLGAKEISAAQMKNRVGRKVVVSPALQRKLERATKRHQGRDNMGHPL